MSLHPEVELSCDGVPQFGCTTHPVFARTGGQARRWAREQGWLVSAPGGEDYCPDHRPDRRPASSEVSGTGNTTTEEER